MQVTVRCSRELVPVDETGELFREVDMVIATACDGTVCYASSLVVGEGDSPGRVGALEELAKLTAVSGLRDHLALS